MAHKNNVALFPGSFDPFTLGHHAIVEQGLGIFNKIVIGIGANSEKHGLLSLENRVKLIKDIYNDNDRVDTIVYEGLTGDYCTDNNIPFMLRGMRNTVDFEYERSIMITNQKIYPHLTTVLLFTPPEFLAISSSMIRELISYNHDTTDLMPNKLDIKNYL